MQTLRDYIASTHTKYEDGKYIYGEAGLHQMLWVRDKAGLLLRIDNDDMDYRDLWKVCSFHTSKSVQLPVYYYENEQLTLVMRNNFHDWNVSVKANKSILIPSYMDVREAGCCEGMENYKFSSYEGSKYKFSFYSPFNEHLWAILWCITTQTKQ